MIFVVITILTAINIGIMCFLLASLSQPKNRGATAKGSQKQQEDMLLELQDSPRCQVVSCRSLIMQGGVKVQNKNTTDDYEVYWHIDIGFDMHLCAYNLIISPSHTVDSMKDAYIYNKSYQSVLG